MRRLRSLSSRRLTAIVVAVVAVAATAAVAVAAWTRTKAHSELAEAYAVTAREVAQIRASAAEVAEEDWRDFVANAEQAFSREHTLWHARRRTAVAP